MAPPKYYVDDILKQFFDERNSLQYKRDGGTDQQDNKTDDNRCQKHRNVIIPRETPPKIAERRISVQQPLMQEVCPESTPSDSRNNVVQPSGRGYAFEEKFESNIQSSAVYHHKSRMKRLRSLLRKAADGIDAIVIGTVAGKHNRANIKDP